jgi:hypothetical protein
MKDTDAIDQERQRRGAELAAELRDAISFPPLLPSPAEVGDLILQTREHVQALGWGNREQLYTESQVRAIMAECAAMAAARERQRLAQPERTRSQKLADAGFVRRPGLQSMEMRSALELIAAPMRPDGTWNRDRAACQQIAAEALGRYEDGA